MSGLILRIRKFFRHSPIDDPNRYERHLLLGEGAMGKVYVATDHNTRKQVAIKKFNQDSRAGARHEKGILSTLKHPNVIKYLGYLEPEAFGGWIVMEKMPTSLESILDDCNRRGAFLDYIDAKLYGFQMFRALNYLHSLNIVHADLKPGNLLVDQHSKVVKICDFGLWQYGGQQFQQTVVTLYYRPPEVAFRKDGFDGAVDVWSAGCVLVELIKGEVLFNVITRHGETETASLLRTIRTVIGHPTAADLATLRPRGSVINFPPIPHRELLANPIEGTIGTRLNNVSANAYHLIRRTVQYQPDRRLKPIEACAHPWFESVRQHPQCALFADEVRDVAPEIVGQFNVKSRKAAE